MTGELYPDPERFPHGIKDLVDYVHGKGLKFGIYTDATTAPCVHGQYDREGGVVPGSYGHYEQDATTFAAWGVDYVKADFCQEEQPDGSKIDPEVAYPAFSRALNAAGRQMHFLACYWCWLDYDADGVPKPRPGYKKPWEFLLPWANAYRVGGDHHDDWAQLAAQIELKASKHPESRTAEFLSTSTTF